MRKNFFLIFENEDQKDQKKEDETETSLDSDYDIDEYKLDEQLVDTDSDKQSNEQVIQKKNLNNIDIEYKIFTNEFDEAPLVEQDIPIARQSDKSFPRLLNSNHLANQVSNDSSDIMDVDTIPLPGAITFLSVNLVISIAAWSATPILPP